MAQHPVIIQIPGSELFQTQGFRGFPPSSHANWSCEAFFLFFFFEPRSGSRIWAGKNKMSKSKKKTPILLERNFLTRAADGFRLTWSGKDCECQRKAGNKTYKKEWRAKVGAFDMTCLTLVVRWQNPTPWKSHFSPREDYSASSQHSFPSFC